MVDFKELKFITPTSLLIDAESLYGSTLKNLYINTEESMGKESPDITKAIYTLEDIDADSFSDIIDLSEQLEKCVKSHIYFISFTWAPGNIDPPCGEDKAYITKGVVYGNEIYEKALRLIKCQKGCGCSGNECEVSPKFANFALEYFRLQTCLELGKNTEALESFNMLLGRNEKSKEIYTSNCSCNDD